jgi:thiosulfate dehydrogenase [quinone] large subunit
MLLSNYMNKERSIDISEPRISKILFSGTRAGWIWLVLRLYLGYQWLNAGIEKIMDPKWIGTQVGSALTGFLRNSLWSVAGTPSSTISPWYWFFANSIVIPHTVLFSYLITYGEIAIGVALTLGAFTGIAAFFSAFLNFNYLFAGIVSVNPLFIIIELFLILAWRNAGWIGLDRWLLKQLGVPWEPGKMFKKDRE